MVINDLSDLIELGIVMIIVWLAVLVWAVYFDRRKP